MRSLSVSSFIFACFVVIGCGSNPTNMPDMSIAGPDMSVTPDMQQLNCAGLIRCQANCGSAGATCIANCDSSTSVQGLVDAKALSDCITGVYTASDGGTPPCSSPADTSPGCQACVQGASTAACAVQFQKCFTD